MEILSRVTAPIGVLLVSAHITPLFSGVSSEEGLA